MASLVALLASGCATTVQGEALAGAPTSVLAPMHDGGLTLRVDYERTADEVNDYWTTERQHDATPFDPIVSDGNTNGAGDVATGVAIDPSTGAVHPNGPQLEDSVAGDLFDATGLAAATQGRLYMTFAGGDYVCSATVINSLPKNIVLTAAHCIWDMESDVYADYVVFIPADANDGAEQPYGMWPVKSITMAQEFADGANETEDGYVTGDGWTYDFAFLTMAPNAQGQEIQEVTGGQGIAFGLPAEEIVVIGYPSAPPFDGTSERYCASTDWEPDSYAYSIDCDMTAGSSGGGWFTNYDVESGSGYAVAATSFGSTGFLGAAPLGATALSLFTELGGM